MSSTKANFLQLINGYNIKFNNKKIKEICKFPSPSITVCTATYKNIYFMAINLLKDNPVLNKVRKTMLNKTYTLTFDSNNLDADMGFEDDSDVVLIYNAYKNSIDENNKRNKIVIYSFLGLIGVIIVAGVGTSLYKKNK